LADIRADTSDGIDFTAAVTNAPSGLVRPTPPNLSSPTLVTAASRANMATHCANGNSNKVITWTPGAYTGGAPITIGGQDLRIIVNDTNWTPDTYECSFVIESTARRVEIIGNNSTWYGGFYIGNAGAGAQDIFLSGLTLLSQSEGTTNPMRSFSDETATSCAAYGHRIMAYHCYFRMPGGTWFTGEDGVNLSTNILFVNGVAYVPTVANAVGWRSGDGTLSGTTWHENPSRFNVSTYCGVIDSRLYADSKHCLRAHNGSGKILWIRNQLERGGWYTVPTPVGSSSTTAIRLRKDKLYRPGGLSSGSGLNIEYGGSPVVNTLLSLKEATYYNDGTDGANGAALLPTGTGAPHSSWATCVDGATSLANGNSYATYVSTPAWDYRTETPTY
jgi:hypothetical protein